MKNWNELNGTEANGERFINKKGHLAEITWSSHNAWTYKIITENYGDPNPGTCRMGSCEFKAEDNIRLATALSKLSK